ncbi:mCG145547, partial [Mus musculus]
VQCPTAHAHTHAQEKEGKEATLLLKKCIYFYFMCVCLSCKCPLSAEESVGSPETGVTRACEPPDVLRAVLRPLQ